MSDGGVWLSFVCFAGARGEAYFDVVGGGGGGGGGGSGAGAGARLPRARGVVQRGRAARGAVPAPARAPRARELELGRDADDGVPAALAAVRRHHHRRRVRGRASDAVPARDGRPGERLEARRDGVVDAEEDPLAPERGGDVGVVERLDDVAGRVGEAELDPAVFVFADDVFDGVEPGRVDARDGAHLEHDEVHLSFARLLVLAKLVFDVVDVCKVDGGVDAEDDDPFVLLRLWVLLDAPVNDCVRQFAEDGGVRPRGVVDDKDERDGNGDGDAELDAEEERPEEGDEPQDEVFARDAPEKLDLVRVDEAAHGGDDDCAERVFGQKVDGVREDEEHKHHDGGGDDGAHARLCPGVVVDGGAREGTGDGVGAEEGAQELAKPEAEELLVGVDFVLVLSRERFGDGDGFHKPDEGDDDGARRDLAKAVKRDILGAELWQARLHLAHHFNPFVFEIAKVDDEGAEDAHHERAHYAQALQVFVRLAEVLHDEKEHYPRAPHDKRRPVQFRNVAENHLERLVQVRALGHFVPEDVLRLGEGDGDGGAGGEAGEHRVREKVDDKAEAEGTHDDLDHAAEEAQRVGVRGVLLRLRLRVHDGAQPRLDKERRERHGPDGELARRTEHRVNVDGHERGVQPVDGGQPSNHRICHRLRHNHNPHRHARDDVRPQLLLRVVLHPTHNGEEGFRHQLDRVAGRLAAQLLERVYRLAAHLEPRLAARQRPVRRRRVLCHRDAAAAAAAARR
mmetsp:Transcript_7502/g.24916  ORF Transcript_7502/g.24916 Transcript_7502/m.24916 type:complete len:738 (+) Transcript_7502:52-2265(+)